MLTKAFFLTGLAALVMAGEQAEQAEQSEQCGDGCGGGGGGYGYQPNNYGGGGGGGYQRFPQQGRGGYVPQGGGGFGRRIQPIQGLHGGIPQTGRYGSGGGGQFIPQQQGGGGYGGGYGGGGNPRLLSGGGGGGGFQPQGNQPQGLSWGGYPNYQPNSQTQNQDGGLYGPTQNQNQNGGFYPTDQQQQQQQGGGGGGSNYQPQQQQQQQQQVIVNVNTAPQQDPNQWQKVPDIPINRLTPIDQTCTEIQLPQPINIYVIDITKITCQVFTDESGQQPIGPPFSYDNPCDLGPDPVQVKAILCSQ